MQSQNNSVTLVMVEDYSLARRALSAVISGLLGEPAGEPLLQDKERSACCVQVPCGDLEKHKSFLLIRLDCCDSQDISLFSRLSVTPPGVRITVVDTSFASQQRFHSNESDMVAWTLFGTPETQRRSGGKEINTGCTFTRREHQVLCHMAKGRTNQQIALELTISRETVKTHVSKILKKLGVSDRTQAALRALERGVNLTHN